jgi:hypothetical protein
MRGWAIQIAIKEKRGSKELYSNVPARLKTGHIFMT